MLGHWLTGINKKDRLLIFVGAALIGAIWCTRNDLIFRKNRLPLLCRLFSEEHIGCDFGPYCSMRNQGRLSVWQAKRSRSSLWISSQKMDGEAIREFAFDYFL